MKQHKQSTYQRCLHGLSKWCAYKQIYTLVVTLIRGGKMSDQTRVGRSIALLGLFCPIFWISLISGADRATLVVHAAHSGVVFLFGLIIVAVSLIKPK